ncbi:MAG: DPP IV N-terminal domain-containing protein [Marinifilaceae bacterium]
MKYGIVTVILLLFMVQGIAQKKVLSMEDAILGYHLRPAGKHVSWQGKTNNYTSIEEKNLVAVNAQTGKSSVLLTLQELNDMLDADLKGFPQYQWHNDNVIIVQHNKKHTEIDVKNKKIVRTIPSVKNAANVTYNANGLMAYTVDNNLYIVDEQGKQTAITADKDKNIVNGQTVSRSEFGISGGIFWSPNGQQLAFYRKDEGAVSTFPLLDITTRTGSLKEIKYPMAGMDSENIQLGVYDIATGKTTFLNVTDFDAERYLTNVAWAPDNASIYIQVLNRGQNHMILNQYDVATGNQLRTLFEEKSDTYVEPQDPIVFLSNDSKHFIYRTNNRDGYFNLYLCDVTGKTVRNMTPVQADVALVGEDGKNIYYTSAEVSPVDNHLFKTGIKSGKPVRLTKETGWHNVKMSADKRYFIDEYSSLNVPRVMAIKNSDGKETKSLLTAQDPSTDYAFGEITLGSIKGKDGVTDHYYRMIKPMDFDATKKYPVIVYVYGGPHSQMVKNTWQAQLRMWEMYMAQRGYLVYVMDNRGTSNRGKAYESAIHKQCGQAEMEDQLQGIEFLKTLPYADMNRVGVHGWSYGGFMTISLTTNYPDIFKVGVAGGPVIDWKWYEVMYGERYMSSPNTNAEGYEKTSLINKAKDLRSKLLICQGAIDDVVLWQHSLSFIRECVKNNKQVDYFPYPRAEHNVIGKDRIHLMQKVTNYFEDYL